MNTQQVVDLVQRYLNVHDLSEAPIEVLPQSVRQDGDWWYVPVRPVHQLPKSYRYYEELTEIEAELKDRENIDVLLVPAA
jgi:hypothetical protein